MDSISRMRISRRGLVSASLAAPALALLPANLMRVAAQDKTVVTMVTDTVGLGDQNFNDLSNAGGMKAAEEFGLDWKVIESVDATSYVPNLTAAAEQGDLTVATGYLLSLSMEEVVPGFADDSFLIIDGRVPTDFSLPEAPNVLSVLFKEHEPSFLVGVAAGLTTKSNKLGVVNGQRIPPVIRYEVGFKAGVKSVNPAAEVVVANTDNFNDATKGKEFALAQYNDGADIVFPVAGATGIGCYEAVKELNKPGEQWILGADVTQDHLAPGFELCVSRKQVDGQVYEGVKAFSEGTFKGGVTLNLGIKEGGGGFEDPNARVPADILAIVKEYEAKIIDGSLVVPSTDEEYDAFIAAMTATPVG